MKNRLIRLLALACALSLLILPVLAEEAVTTEENAVIGAINGNEISVSTIREYASVLYDYGYLESADDLEGAFDYVTTYIFVLPDKITELGFDVFTEDEQKELYAQAEAEMQEYYDDYVAYGKANDPDADEEALYQEAYTLYNGNGIDASALYQQILENEAFNRLMESIDTTYTEEELQAYYQEYYVETDRAYFEGNADTYDIYSLYYGYESSYIPCDYRGVLQILVTFADEDMDAYTEAIGAEGVTGEQIAEAKQTLMATKEDVFTDIYARLEAGEAFTDLIAVYNEDPGMSGDTLNEGYLVREGSQIFDPAFVDAVFSMEKVGDWSEPSIGSYGAYITYYLRDIPAGPVELTEARRAEIGVDLESKKVYDQIDTWTAEYDIEYFGTAEEAAE